MDKPLDILNQYWGYTSFRGPQESIIQSVLEGSDTLAIMPTGGGKSICFQVPAMMKPGICLVISPLIALMKDQVQQLRALDIKAVAVHTGMSPREIDILLDNCIYGQIKFLYVSPERLQTELFKTRLAKMEVNLLVVDEAHCISEWGYDFRPSYLAIAAIRELLPDIPVMALTATATPEVRTDITKQLEFKNGREFQMGFERPNLSYGVRLTEDKVRELIQLLKNNPGSALVYVNTRKKTKIIAVDLRKQGYKASFYHGGMSPGERSSVQDQWVQGAVRVMVATNAFGMGINKADVRLVVHLEMPGNLESYYQEAGRAGRDGKPSNAVLLYQPGDYEAFDERKDHEYPDATFLQQVYQHVANYYQIARGSQPPDSFDFDLDDFSKRYHLNPLKVFHALQKLKLFGLIELTESFFQPSRFQFTVNHQLLYEFQIANAPYDPLIKALLRLHGGEVFTNPIVINENKVARLLQWEVVAVQRLLKQLQDRELCIYQPQKDRPQLLFTTPRQDPDRLVFDQKTYQKRRQLEKDKLKAVKQYIQNTLRCRSQQLSWYFGEHTDKTCGVCDICVPTPAASYSEFEERYRAIINELHRSPLTLMGLSARLPEYESRELARTIQIMLDNGDITYDRLGRLIVALGMA